MRRPIALIAALLALAAGAAGGVCYWRAEYGPVDSPYDPDAIAAAETRMWQAYYARDPLALSDEMLALMEQQFGLTGSEAQQVAGGFMRGAMYFQMGAPQTWNAQALPEIEAGYAALKALTDAEFDPRAAAQAELAWWAARRTPGQNSPEQVGGLIAALYAELYGGPNWHIEKAGLLRAEAAHIRDTTGDWARSEETLRRSYRALVRGTAGKTWRRTGEKR